MKGILDKIKNVIYIINYILKRIQCHITGEYRGSVHKICNTDCSLTQKIPVIFHNLKYDSYHIMQEIGRIDQKLNVKPYLH